MELLENSRWGFESNCFVCEPRNDAGLGIEFYRDTATEAVIASFELDGRFSGAPSYVHGGLVLAVLDEAMAWATIALSGCFAVTKETTTRFRAPVKVGSRYDVRATVTSDDDEQLICEAEISDQSGRTCAAAHATFVPLGPAQMTDAVGAVVEGPDTEFVRSQDGER
ncbi:MAG: PaaI family thioesterase [Acidimicrobiales bacterium]